MEGELMVDGAAEIDGPAEGSATINHQHPNHQLFKSLTELLQTFHAAVTTQRWDSVNLTV